MNVLFYNTRTKKAKLRFMDNIGHFKKKELVSVFADRINNGVISDIAWNPTPEYVNKYMKSFLPLTIHAVIHIK